MANNEISLEELAKHMEGLELTDTALEGVVGGVLSESAQQMLMLVINQQRGKGATLDEALDALPGLYEKLSSSFLFGSYLADTNIEEVAEFLKANW